MRPAQSGRKRTGRPSRPRFFKTAGDGSQPALRIPAPDASPVTQTSPGRGWIPAELARSFWRGRWCRPGPTAAPPRDDPLGRGVLSHARRTASRPGRRRLGAWRTASKDDVHRQVDELGSQVRKPVVAPLGIAVLEGDVLAFQPAEFTQPLAEGLETGCGSAALMTRSMPSPGTVHRRRRGHEWQSEQAEGAEDEETNCARATGH